MVNVNYHQYPPRLMKAADAAQYLGISVRMLSNLVAQSEIPRKQVESMKLFDREDLDEYANGLEEAE